ncbi:MAG TPA: hypothetical protein VLH56_19220 [Dissulfurispiraceae bacterium]|nr:hypothetical protein [Dissulfurispiraceae bacterium]
MAQVKALDVVEWGGLKHRVADLVVNPNAEFYDNLAQTPERDRDITRPGVLWSGASFTTQACGSGTAGAPPDAHLLLNACGMRASVVAATSVTYTLDPAFTHTPLDIDCYRGNQYLISADNCTGTCEWVFTPGAPCLENWTFSGIYQAPTDASGTAAMGASARPPICKGLTATFAGSTVCMKEARISLGNVYPDPDRCIAGTNGIQDPALSDRDVTFSAVIRLPLVASLDIWGMITAETPFAMHIVLGGVAGNITTYDIEGYAMETPAPSESEGFHEITVRCRMSWLSGDTQLTIAYT